MASVGPLAFGGSDFSANFTTDNGSFTETTGVLQSSTASDLNRARCTNVAMDTANHTVYATVGGRDSSNCGSVVARQASATWTAYFGAFVEYSVADGYRIVKVVGGSETDLDTAASGSGAHDFELTVDGSSQSLVVDTVEVCTAADSAISSGTYAGVYAYNNNGGQWDDWGADDVAAGPIGAANILRGTNEGFQQIGGNAT